MQDVADILASAAKQAFETDAQPEVTLASGKFGDFASNLPFKLAGGLKRSPKDVAAALAKAVKDDRVDKAEPAGAGFVNLTMSAGYWADQLKAIGPKFGRGEDGKKVQVEFISANPTGPLTLGNARGGFIGDAVARVLEHRGHDVTREYYFNDAGNQIQKLVESVKAAAGIGDAEDIQYRGDYVHDLARQFEAELKTTPDDQLGHKITHAIFKQYLEPAVKRLGIEFDVWFNERQLVESGQTERAVERLKGEGLIYDKDGAVWLAVSKLKAGERDRVLVKSNQRADLTYLVNDLPYHINILEERGFDLAIKVLGADHHGQVQSLVLPMKRLFPDKDIDVILYQLVRLLRGGQEVKMSKRAGTFVTVDDLLDDVPADVARFFFLMRSADSHMDFDLDLAKEESAKNPYWYVMYSSARAFSIIKQAKKRDIAPATQIDALTDPERQLVKQMLKFGPLLEETEYDYGVHRLTHYGLDLARAFTEFYESQRIIDLEPEIASQKLYIVQQYIELIKLYCQVVGLKVVEQL